MTTARTALPPRVDPLDPAVIEDPHPAYARLGESRPICQSGLGRFMVLLHADVSALPRLGNRRDGEEDGAPMFGGGPATVAGTGVAIAASVLWPTPGIDPHRRANASDVGDNLLVYRIATWVTFLLTSPTVVLAVLVALDPGWLGTWAHWALVPLAVGNGAVVWWFLGNFAAHHLAGRLPETLARLRHTANPSSLGEFWSSLTKGLNEHPATHEQETDGFEARRREDCGASTEAAPRRDLT